MYCTRAPCLVTASPLRRLRQRSRDLMGPVRHRPHTRPHRRGRSTRTRAATAGAGAGQREGATVQKGRAVAPPDRLGCWQVFTREHRKRQKTRRGEAEAGDRERDHHQGELLQRGRESRARLDVEQEHGKGTQGQEREQGQASDDARGEDAAPNGSQSGVDGTLELEFTVLELRQVAGERRTEGGSRQNSQRDGADAGGGQRDADEDPIAICDEPYGPSHEIQRVRGQPLVWFVHVFYPSPRRRAPVRTLLRSRLRSGPDWIPVQTVLRSRRCTASAGSVPRSRWSQRRSRLSRLLRSAERTA